MATIINKGAGYSVVYRGYKNGKRKQIWETFKTEEEALIRKKQIEIADKKTSMTVEELMIFFIETYGRKRWSPKTYEDKTGRINNYIIPIIGKQKITQLNAVEIDRYFISLEKTPAIMGNGQKSKGRKVSPRTIREIYILLKGAFDLALKYDLIDKNPINHIILPEVENKKRDIWDIETFLRAVSECNLIMSCIINLCFSLTGRYGEVGGLLWKNVHIDDENSPYIEIKTEIIRLNKSCMEKAKEKEIVFEFPNMSNDNKTVLVLTLPKTKGSVRKVWIPNTVADKLRSLRERQEKMKLALGSEYSDFGLVIAQDNGRPIENKLFNKWLCKLCKQHNLPIIKSHAFRHLGATVKYDLSGNLTVVQGDTGHSSAKVLTETYLHTTDAQRQGLASQIDQNIYGSTKSSDDMLLERIKNEPQLLEKIKAILVTC